MRKWVVLAVSIVSMLMIASVSVGSSAHGSYNGVPIVKVTSSGSQLNVTDVPAMAFQGRTVIPVYLLRQLGVEVNYDAPTQTVDVKLPTQKVQEHAGLSLEELNRIGESVAKVYALNAQGQTIATGSAFVTEQTLVTNSHVLDGAESIRVEFIKEEQTYKVSETLFNDVEKDVAGFRYSGGKKSLLISTANIAKGSAVYAIGFPQGRFTLSEGTIGSVLDFDYREIVSTANTEPGSSGGALIGEDGKVIGVIRGGYEGYSNALHYSELLDEMEM